MKKCLLISLTLFLIASFTTSYGAILVTNQNASFSSPTTTINFRLNVSGTVTVLIKETGGNTTVKTISAGAKSAGVNFVVWDGSKDGGGVATTGQYYAVISASGSVVSTYTPLLGSPILFTQGAALAYNKNAADVTHFGHLYATDWNLKVIRMYYPDGTFIRSTSGYNGVWGIWGASAPYGIAVDTSSNVWVNDRSNTRTIIFDPEVNWQQTVAGTQYTRIGICVTGDTTNGALYVIRATADVSTDIQKKKVVNGVFDALTIITPTTVGDIDRALLAKPDDSIVYEGQIGPAPALLQYSGSDYGYAQTGWTTSVDSVLGLDFTLDGQNLWVATADTNANMKKVQISDGAVLDSFQAGTGIAGKIAVDPAGNIAVFDGGNQFGGARLNIYQPPDSGSSWQSRSNAFGFTAPANLAPSIDSSSANPASIPANGISTSVLTVYVSDGNGYTDDTAVAINLTQIGGSAAQSVPRISGSGINGVYQTSVTAVLSSKAGDILLPVYAYDSGGNISSGNVNLHVSSGVISGRVTISDSTVGIGGATVTASGGSGPYTAISGSDGSYSMEAGTGSNYTVSASKTGWNGGATQSNVAVIFGSTTQNVNVSIFPNSVAAAKSLPLPATVAVGGVVLVPRGAGVPPPWGLSGQYYLADEGSSIGLRVNNSVVGRYPKMGDKIVLEGTISIPGTQYNELLIDAPSFFAQIGAGGNVGSPVASSCLDVASTNYGKFITLSNVTVIAVNVSTNTSSFTVQDAGGTALVLYDTNSTISDAKLPLPSIGTTLTVTGVIGQESAWILSAELKPWYIVQVSVDPLSIRLTPGQTHVFTATGGTEPYVWTSSDLAVGTIDTFGVFTAIANGSCTVTATDANGYPAYASVMVQATNAPLAVEPNRSIYRRESFGELFE